MDIHIRELRDGRIASETNSFSVVEVFINQRIFESLTDATFLESDHDLLSLRWEHDYPLTSTVTLDARGNYSALVQELEKDLSEAKVLIRKLYMECKMMLLKLSVFPLVLTIQHQESDTFHKYHYRMMKLLQAFLKFYVRAKLEWNIRITRLHSNLEPRRSNTHLDMDDRDRSTRNTTEAKQKQLKERFSKIENEMVAQRKLFEEHTATFQAQHKLLKEIIAKIMDSLQVRSRTRNHTEDIGSQGGEPKANLSFRKSVSGEYLSKDGESSLQNQTVVKEEQLTQERIEKQGKEDRDNTTNVHARSEEGTEAKEDRKRSKKTQNSGKVLKQTPEGRESSMKNPVSITEHTETKVNRDTSMKNPQSIDVQKQKTEKDLRSTLADHIERQTSEEETIIGILDSEDDSKDNNAKKSAKGSHASKTNGKPRITVPRIDLKKLPLDKVDDYREASREWGISKDDTQQEGEDAGSSILASLIQQQRNHPLRAEVRKHKLDSTERGRKSIHNFLSTDAFTITDDDEARTALWRGVMETTKSEERMREEGLDTVICIHTSYGLDERAFHAVEEFVLALLVGLEDQSKTHELIENVGLIAADDDTPVVHHLSDDLKSVGNKLKGIGSADSKMKIRPSSLNKSLLLGLAGLSKAGSCTFGELTVHPRMFIMTDGIKDDISSPKQAALRSALRAFGGDHIRKILVDPIVWIPIGKGNQDSLHQMVQLSNGTLFDNIRSLTSYQNIKRCSADVLAYMRSDADSDESHLERALDACGGKKLTFEEKRTISLSVAHKLTKMPRELGEIDNLENVNICENLPPHGSRVVRGPDWKYNDQDSGLPGTIINHDSSGERVWVLWDSKSCASYGYSISQGYDVVLTDDPEQQVHKFDIGRKVTRGPHWCYGNEDGGNGSTGVIIRAKKGWLKVRWENGSIHDYQFDSEVFEIWVI